MKSSFKIITSLAVSVTLLGGTLTAFAENGNAKDKMKKSVEQTVENKQSDKRANRPFEKNVQEDKKREELRKEFVSSNNQVVQEKKEQAKQKAEDKKSAIQEKKEQKVLQKQDYSQKKDELKSELSKLKALHQESVEINKEINNLLELIKEGFVKTVQDKTNDAALPEYVQNFQSQIEGIKADIESLKLLRQEGRVFEGHIKNGVNAKDYEQTKAALFDAQLKANEYLTVKHEIVEKLKALLPQ